MIIYIYYIDYSWEQVPNSCSLRFINLIDDSRYETLISEGGRFGV